MRARAGAERQRSAGDAASLDPDLAQLAGRDGDRSAAPAPTMIASHDWIKRPRLPAPVGQPANASEGKDRG